MSEIILNFNQEDTNLNLRGVVKFQRQIPVGTLTIAGLDKWRHVPANIIQVSEETIEYLKLSEYSAKFAKVGLNWIGIKARSNILLSHAIRESKKLGLQKVQDQLTKFFKTLGATSIKFEILDVARELDNDDSDDDDSNM